MMILHGYALIQDHLIVQTLRMKDADIKNFYTQRTANHKRIYLIRANEVIGRWKK